MILGMTPLTFVHVVISLVAIAAGLAWLAKLVRGSQRRGVTDLFLITTLATTVTGFLFPITVVTPAVAVGFVSLVLLAAAFIAHYMQHLSGAWRGVYVITAIAALYLNVFVLVVQAFQKVPALNALAPTGSEPVFAFTQGLVLCAFILAGVFSMRRFHPMVA